MTAPHFWSSLDQAKHGNPFADLGVFQQPDGLLWRIWNPTVSSVASEGWTFHLVAPGLFEGKAANLDLVPGRYVDDENKQWHDPYCFDVILDPFDLERFAAGEHLHLERVLGANPMQCHGITGTLFSVWAPNAQAVSVIGDWNNWQPNNAPMRHRHEAGVWELFIPAVEVGAQYQFSILSASGRKNKIDPYC